MRRLHLSKKVLTLFFVPWLFLLGLWWLAGAEEREANRVAQAESEKVELVSDTRAKLAEQLGPDFLQQRYPSHIEINWDGAPQKANVQYSLDPDLQAEAEKLLKSYKPDYGAVVIMDALTGRVRALVSYQKNTPDHQNLALRGTFPAASIFKIVTATAAVDKYNLSPDTLIFFNGGNYTLYKKNVMETKHNRWTRGMSIREAFGRSINTVFGRLTFEHLKPKDLEEYAVRFGFNQKVQSDLPFDPGFTHIPDEKVFALAEIASGYNKVTRMSPIQGAMIAASIASAGKMPVPTIVDKVESENGKTIYKSEPITAAITMTPEGAERLKIMMESTITRGTSRKAFRPLMKDRKFRELELGGKTGSLTGDNPRGKVDWFVGYAIGGAEDRLAIAAITVNVEKWTVKSAHLAQSLFKKHYKEQFSNRNDGFFSAASQSPNE